jgi:N6-L-threonylcarbamoyladenine synthase
MQVSLGIDTSCYTTSVAALNDGGKLLAEARIPLIVKAGGRGLAQSEMVFQHVRNLPVLMDEMRRMMGKEARIVAVGASARPRPLAESYMPAFLVGLGAAKTLAAAVCCPVFELSHQENHILAGMWSVGGEFDSEFLVLHASGGTTEILLVRKKLDCFEVHLVGGTRDLHAGQFIDRVGVALGLPFPAGPHLEQLAKTYTGQPAITPISVEGTHISLSGPGSHVQRWLTSSPDPAEVAASIQHCLAESLRRSLGAAVSEYGVKTVMLVGGVAANQYIRKQITDGLAEAGVTVRLPDPRFSGDNAVGSAWWAFTHKAVLATEVY